MTTTVDRHAPGYEPRWDIDFAVGRQAEMWVSDIITALGTDAIEVKADERALRTGNLYVEYECRGKPSGIAITRAVLWIYVLNVEQLALVVSVERLKVLGREALRAGRDGSCTRGSHPTRGALVRLSDVMARCEGAVT